MMRYKLIAIWLAGFYGISTLIGYLMPNPIYVVGQQSFI